MKTIIAATAAIVLSLCSASHAQTLHVLTSSGATSVSSYPPFANSNFKAFPALLHGGNWFTASQFAATPLEDQAASLEFKMKQLPGGGLPPLPSEVTIFGLTQTFNENTLVFNTLSPLVAVNATVTYDGIDTYTFTVLDPTPVGGIGGTGYAYLIGAPNALSGEEWYTPDGAMITTVPEPHLAVLFSAAGIMLILRRRA